MAPSAVGGELVAGEGDRGAVAEGTRTHNGGISFKNDGDLLLSEPELDVLDGVGKSGASLLSRNRKKTEHEKT